MSTDVAGRLEVVILVDCGCDHRSRIAHFEMLLVAEMNHPGGRGTRDVGRLVASLADLLIRQEVVFGFRAGGRRRMAPRALELELQVQFMRKGSGIRSRAPDPNPRRNERKDQLHPL